MSATGNKIVKAKADIDLIDETFDVSQSENYYLSVQTGLDRLSFCVFNTVINKYVVLRSYLVSGLNLDSMTTDCRAIFEKDDLLGLRYKNSSHLWISPHFTFVPEHLFDSNEADLYLTFNHEVAANEQTLQNYVRPAGLYSVFSYPETLTALLKLFQPDINLFHHTTPFIENLIRGRIPSSISKLGMAAYFYSGNLDIVLVKNNKLLFYNTFEINAPADSVYYLTIVANQFEIDLSSTKLMYAGSLKDMSPETVILKDYVEVVECEPPDTVTYSHYMQEPMRKNFINLFSL